MVEVVEITATDREPELTAELAEVMVESTQRRLPPRLPMNWPPLATSPATRMLFYDYFNACFLIQLAHTQGC